MTFDEWLEQYFGAMRSMVPAHLRHAYIEAYTAGLEEGRKQLRCPGCGGSKMIQVRVQRHSREGGRQCVEEEQPCPVCHGSGIATARHMERFFGGTTTL